MENFRNVVGACCMAGLILLAASPGFALDTEVRGQISGWTAESYARDEWRNQSGIRYLPQLTVSCMLKNGVFWDIDAALNGFAVYSSLDDDVDADVQVYRLTARLATNQTETRVGLQKINFGPARLLRPLRWFDQLDRRDPQGMTEGVHGLLFRYTAMNNANAWLWGLYGNDEVKGFEHLPSVRDNAEFGGRVQYPALRGEVAATAHTRMVDGDILDADDFRETRVALDGRWEYGVGLWTESVLQYQDSEDLPYAWTTMTTLGLDYTFGIGNGLYAVLEHMATGASEHAFGWNEDAHISACMLSYPMGLFDSVSSISFYNWELEEFSQHISWQRAYDNLSIDVSLFRYPDRDQSAGQQTGSGGQLMLMYYH